MLVRINHAEILIHVINLKIAIIFKMHISDSMYSIASLTEK